MSDGLDALLKAKKRSGPTKAEYLAIARGGPAGWRVHEFTTMKAFAAFIAFQKNKSWRLYRRIAQEEIIDGD